MSALVNCGVCKLEISNEALSCPHCGHPRKGHKKKMGFLKSLFSVIFLMWFIGMIMSQTTQKSSVSNASKAPTLVPPKPKSEAELKAEKIRQRLEAKFGAKPDQSGWDGSYREVKRYLKKAANDPGSIKIETCTPVSYDEKVGWLVGCDYRGKNAFGALVKNSNWFAIRNGTVIKVLPAGSYK